MSNCELGSVDMVKSSASSSVELLDVVISRVEPLEFTIFGQYRNELLSLCAKNKDLLISDRAVSLFENESLMDKLPKTWLYNKELHKSSERMIAMTGDEITALFVNYFKDGICPGWLKADPYFDDLEFDDPELGPLHILKNSVFQLVTSTCEKNWFYGS